MKKIVNKKLLNYKLEDSEDKINTIGIIIDETYFADKVQLINELINNGFDKDKLTVLIFKEKIKAKETIEEPFYSLKDISISGKINKVEVQKFIDTPFDLLINYYDESRASLNMIAKKSKAKFKVGFNCVDKRINHLTIASEVENYKEFITELVKYLKILNKIE